MPVHTGLTTPLDQWVGASARSARLDMLLRSYSSAGRNDHSHLHIDDALPLLSHACKTGFGDLTALEFGVKVSQGPLAYSSVLTITGPDDIGIEFPDSGNHATREQAKVHAAYKAVLGGAIGYIMQSAGPATLNLNEPAVHLPTSPKLATQSVSKTAPSAAPEGVASNVKQGKKPRGSKQKAPPDALNRINTYLQRVYRDHKTPMPKSSQEWKVVYFQGGVAARLIIRLPSGSSRSYGDLPGRPSEPGTSPKIYSSTMAAKREVASNAVDAGVLQFIEFDKPEGVPQPQPPSPTTSKIFAHAPLSAYVAYDPLKAPRATGANLVPISGIARPLANVLPPRPSFPSPRPEENVPSHNVGPVPPLEQALDPPEIISSYTAPPRPTRSPSPPDEMEVVDELLGPASLSNQESSEHEDEEELDELHSSECGNDRPLSEGRSESMELDSDSGTPPKEISVNHIENKASSPRDEPEPEPEPEPVPVDEPPQKKQRTEPPKSPIQEPNEELNPQEPRTMHGTSFSSILSGSISFFIGFQNILSDDHLEFCFERGHAQPQVTYQRSFEQSRVEGPVMYSVSISLGGSRFELAKQYESIELAEEKLSKRILRQFGVRAKKI
ncbi:unnamed protein product [Rhizoctonia solani]|uniref:Uncharacterized protein n=1 Tax=Rhizoctonia solani TaxID=456999 RepID=A0A8H3HBT7_9AGAM|nr:unnamed protein product [Rhizoctonia solani]